MKGAENMDYKKAVSDTLNGMKGSFRPESDAEFGRKIRERAKIMSNNNDNVRHINFREITPEYVEPKKSHKALKVVAGVAGTAAVLAGGVFGLKWLNDNGGLKGPDVQGTGAGYSSNADTTAADTNEAEFTTIFHSYSINGSGYVKVDQKYGVDDDITVHLKGYKFDGTWAKIYYDVIYKDEIMGGEIKQIAPKETENGHTESLEYAINANYAYCTANYRLDTPADSVNVSFGYKDDQQSDIFSLTMQKSTDMIDEPIATTAVYVTTPPVEATTATTVLPYYPDELSENEGNDVIASFLYDDGIKVNVRKYEFDGKTLNLYYDVVFDENNNIDPEKRNFAAPKISYFAICDSSNSRASIISETETTLSMVETLELSDSVKSVIIYFLPSDLDAGTVPDMTMIEYSYTATVNSNTVIPVLGKRNPLTDGIPIIDPYDTETESKLGVSICVTGETKSRVEFIISQNGGTVDGEILYTPAYWIEKKNGDKWEELPTLTGEPAVWNAKDQVLERGSGVELGADFDMIYGALPIGEYRLCKNICCGSITETVYAGFMVASED